MAERAHPDDPGFRECVEIRKLFGMIPLRRSVPNPYRDALFWRYAVVNAHCRGKRVLDVPCGMGWGTSLLSGCSMLHGVDISAGAIEEARRRYGDRAVFHVGSMERLDFPDRMFDLVSCLEGIEHVSEAVALSFLAEVRRVLDIDGLLVVSSPHCNTAPHSGNPYHLREYRPEEMRALLGAHFQLEQELTRRVDNLTITVFHARQRA